jgi:hypothetical protein
LAIIQGFGVYTGEGGHRYVYQVINRTRGYISKAISLSNELAESLEQGQKEKYELLTTRLVAFTYLMTNALHVASYQSQIDQITPARQYAFEERLAQNLSLSARSKMMELARSEIVNNSNLIKLLEAQTKIGNIIDHAKTKDEEYPRLLGPDLIDQLYKKNKIMISHWSDYNNIFSIADITYF